MVDTAIVVLPLEWVWERWSLMGVGTIDNASVNIASLICYCVYVKRKKRYDNYRHIYFLERRKFDKFNFIYKSEMNKNT